MLSAKQIAQPGKGKCWRQAYTFAAGLRFFAAGVGGGGVALKRKE